MQAWHAALVDVEIFADQLAQQLMRSLHLLAVQQLLGLLHSRKRPLGVLRATQVSIRSRSPFSRQRQSGFSAGRS